MDIRVLAFKNGILKPEIAETTVSIKGTAFLIQRIVKTLLTIAGSDRLDPDYGVGIQAVLPNFFDDRDLGRNRMNVIEALIRAEKQIKDEDSTVVAPPEEKLSSLNLKDLRFDSSTTQWVVEISVRDMRNVIVPVNLGI